MMSVMIGFFGIFTHHPLFTSWKLNWWTRGPLIGILFFLILVLLAKDELGPFMSLDIVAWTGLTSPYWAILDGAILGGFIGYITTKICGEGNLPLE
jgi:amino acid transporter